MSYSGNTGETLGCLRQAIAKAVDKKRVIQLVNGRGAVAAGILPPTMPGYNPDLAGIPRVVVLSAHAE